MSWAVANIEMMKYVRTGNKNNQVVNDFGILKASKKFMRVLSCVTELFGFNGFLEFKILYHKNSNIILTEIIELSQNAKKISKLSHNPPVTNENELWTHSIDQT